MNTEKSPALNLLSHVWTFEGSNSYSWRSSIMQDALRLAITAHLKFDEDDFIKIANGLSSGFWLGLSANGKHKGEGFYNCAVQFRNASAVQAYEKAYGRKPFLLDGKRVYTGYDFRYEGRFCTVTGWTETNQEITVVSYDKGYSQGKRKLLKFDSGKWLKERNKMKAY